MNNKLFHSNHILLLILIATFQSCVPTQLPSNISDVSSSGFVDKDAERKIASTNAENDFNALSVQMNTKIGDREFIYNVFIDVFGPTAGAIVSPFILQKGDSFNGGCSQYEGNYLTSVITNTDIYQIEDPNASCGFATINAPITGTENSTREGLRIEACEKIVSDNNSLFYLIDKVTGNTNVQASFSTNPTEAHISKIYQRFYPGRIINSDVMTSLKAISQAASLTTAKDRFKLVTLTICMGADWQHP
jgi:hypothetical protein